MSEHTSYDDLVEAMEKLKTPRRGLDFSGLSRPMDFMDIKIFEHNNDIPVLQLSESVEVTDEFRKQFNQWAINLFGCKSIMPRDTALMLGDYGVVINSESIAMLIDTTA